MQLIKCKQSVFEKYSRFARLEHSCSALKTSLTAFVLKGTWDIKHFVLLTGDPPSSGRTRETQATYSQTATANVR